MCTQFKLKKVKEINEKKIEFENKGKRTMCGIVKYEPLNFNQFLNSKKYKIKPS